jgi:hypothetical protein
LALGSGSVTNGGNGVGSQNDGNGGIAIKGGTADGGMVLLVAMGMQGMAV